MTSASTLSQASGFKGAGHEAGTGKEPHAGDRSRELANHTFDQLSQAVESARNTAVPAIEKLSSGAESLAHRSVEFARTGSRQMRDQALLASEKTVGYIRQEPVKSMMFALVAGALLTLLLSSGEKRHG